MTGVQTCALPIFCGLSAGYVYCAGGGRYFNKGTVLIPGISGADFISAAGGEFCANGPVYADCFGNNRYRFPVLPPGGVEHLAPGFVTYAIDTADNVWFWFSTPSPSELFQPFSNQTKIASISSGKGLTRKSCGIDTQGQVWCWGDPRIDTPMVVPLQ